MAKATRITHLALPVTDVERSAAFYRKWASLEFTGDVKEQVGRKMAGLTDSDRSFVLVLIESPDVTPLANMAHVGVSVGNDDEVNRVAEEAMDEGCLSLMGPTRVEPAGASAFLTDPDGHQVEVYSGKHAGIEAG